MKEYNFTEEGKCNYWWGFQLPAQSSHGQKRGNNGSKDNLLLMPLKKFKQTLIYMIFGELKIQQLVAILGVEINHLFFAD